MADVSARIKEYEAAIESYAHAGVDTLEADFKALEKRVHEAWQKVEAEAGELGDEAAAELKKAHLALVNAFHSGEHDVRVALDKVEGELDEVRAKIKAYIEKL